MFKSQHLKRWQVVALTCMGAVAGVLLLSVAERWRYYLMLYISGSIHRLDIPMQEFLVQTWINSFRSFYLPEMGPIIVVGALLGAVPVWVRLHQEDNPLLAARSCLWGAVLLLLVLVSWRLDHVLKMYDLAIVGFAPPRTPLLVRQIMFGVCDIALLITLALWRWGVLLRRKSSEPQETS